MLKVIWLLFSRYEIIFSNYNNRLKLPDRLFGQSSWLQFRRSGFDSRHYRIFWEVCNGVHSASWVQLRSYLEEKVAAPV
jgi:hypothetical protein